jgi:uncharacterized damage-inducible protein DinB
MEITSVESFLKYLESIRGRTRRVVELIPPDRVEWAPRDGAFTLGDTVRHLAALERWMFAENAAGRPSRYAGCGRELADGRDALLAYFDRMRAESLEIFRALSDNDLQRPCTTPGGATMATWKWLRAMVEHEVHHRGQVYLMLNVLGVPTPPMYGLTSEEVASRSVRPEPAAAP